MKSRFNWNLHNVGLKHTHRMCIRLNDEIAMCNIYQVIDKRTNKAFNEFVAKWNDGHYYTLDERGVATNILY